MKRGHVLILLSLSLLVTASTASADLIAYEGFDFVGVNEGDELKGNAGATSFGFAEPFRYRTDVNASASGFFVADSLAGDVVTPKTRGGSARLNDWNRVYRNLSQPIGTENGTYYMSFLLYSGDDNGFEFSYNSDWNSGVKGAIGCGDNTDVRLRVGNSYTVIAPANELHFYVLKFELGPDSDTVSVFVDPALSTVEPVEPTLSVTVNEFMFDRIRYTRYNSSAECLLDEFRLGETYADVMPIAGAAINVNPVDGTTDVALDAQLQWQVGTDPNEIDGLFDWDAVAGYYVYVGDSADPNMVLMTPEALTSAIFDPDLNPDMTYYWQIEETFENGQGGLYVPGDPNNVIGPVWTFETIKTNPSITEQPQELTRADVGTTVMLSILAENAGAYQWYFSGDDVVGDDTIIAGAVSETLTLNDVQAADQGYYYCVVSKTGTVSATSAMGQLVINRLLAWYQFENNLDDSVGTNHGTPAGMPMQYINGIITADSQAYAADPNGSMYGLLPEGTYPKTGLGNGMERYTYSAWVKLADSTQGGHLFGQFNVGYGTCVRFSINIPDGDISFYMRQEGSSSLVGNVGNLSIDDNQWHFVAVTYDGSELVVYYDGKAVRNTSSALTNFAEWQFPMPILAVNSRGTLAEFFSGEVDDLRIYNYALTAEEMAQTNYDVTGNRVCLYGNPAQDLSGNCIVDLEDVAILAENWLVNGFYPVN